MLCLFRDELLPIPRKSNFSGYRSGAEKAGDEHALLPRPTGEPEEAPGAIWRPPPLGSLRWLAGDGYLQASMDFTTGTYRVVSR